MNARKVASSIDHKTVEKVREQPVKPRGIRSCSIKKGKAGLLVDGRWLVRHATIECPTLD